MIRLFIENHEEQRGSCSRPLRSAARRLCAESHSNSMPFQYPFYPFQPKYRYQRKYCTGDLAQSPASRSCSGWMMPCSRCFGRWERDVASSRLPPVDSVSSLLQWVAGCEGICAVILSALSNQASCRVAIQIMAASARKKKRGGGGSGEESTGRRMDAARRRKD